MKEKYDLSEPAQVPLGSASAIGDMAAAEGWEPEAYAVALSRHIINRDLSLDRHRERLAQLANIGEGLAAEQASAGQLSQHNLILESLMLRFADEAVRALRSGSPRASEIAERYVRAALGAHRAAVSCLSALAVLRDRRKASSPSPSPDNDGDDGSGASGGSAPAVPLVGEPTAPKAK